MKLIISAEDKLDQWERLIETIEKSDVPIEFVNRILLTFKQPAKQGDEQNINVQQLRSHGWTDEDIEQIVQEVVNENPNNIQAIYFFLDVENVADVVQRHTDKFLKGIK